MTARITEIKFTLYLLSVSVAHHSWSHPVSCIVSHHLSPSILGSTHNGHLSCTHLSFYWFSCGVSATGRNGLPMKLFWDIGQASGNQETLDEALAVPSSCYRPNSFIHSEPSHQQHRALWSEYSWGRDASNVHQVRLLFGSSHSMCC